LYVNPNTNLVSINEDSLFTEQVWPNTTEGTQTCWTWGKEKVVTDNKLLIGILVNGSWQIFRKDYLFDLNGNKALTLVKSLWIDKEINNDYGKKAIKELFNNNVMDFPKAPVLISKLIKSGLINDDEIVLDFFSGSATTAQSILELNAADMGRRKFIMVQIPQIIDENHIAFSEGIKTISQLGVERIKRVSTKIKEEKSQKAKNDGLFAEFNDSQDYGFRVYRLDESNMQDVYYKPQDYTQSSLDLFADNVKVDRTSDDLLAQVMLDWGLPLNLKIETKEIRKKQVYMVAENSLYACFDKGIDEDFAKELAAEKPLRVVFKDNAFKDDTAKTNVKQLLKQLSPTTEMKVI
jgi:adenine-specific DNA-methyltransferase